MRSTDFKDTTRLQVITRGAAQSNKILADFKGAPRRSRGSKAATCACGGPVRK